MSRFMMAWELGGGLGHLRDLACLAQALLQRGHTVDLVVKDLSMAAAALGEAADAPGLRLWQAPVWLPRLTGLPEPASHAELLFHAGYLDAHGLGGLARAWRSLLTQCQPELLLADHAPTALLAARGLPLRTAVFGLAFALPPRRQPLPLLRDWEAPSPDRLAAAEQRALQSCNEVLDRLRVPPLSALHELYDTDEQLLTGWPELDPHLAWRDDPGPRHWGLLDGPTPSAPGRWTWPPTPGPRIVGYLQRSHPAIAAVLAALRTGPGHTVLHLAGCSREEAGGLSNVHLQVEPEPLDLPAMLADADLWLGQAGAGATHRVLRAGVPAVLLPLQLEQLLQARRVVALGAGVLLWPQEVAEGLRPAIQAVTGSAGFREAARTLAARHPGNGLASIVARCEALAAQAA